MLIWITVAQFILIIWVVIYLALNAHFLWRAEPVTGTLPHSPRVSVCVPARNEERDIRACLISLLEQDYPHFEVIVVDDNSTDGTLAIIHELQEHYPQLVVISGGPLPEEWYGKPFALHQASQKASGELLLFTDADPVFTPQTLATAVGQIQEHSLDMLTLLPGTEFGSFWERAIQPVIFSFIAALTRFREVSDPQSEAAMGVGAFIMVRRDAYDRVGGHESLRQAILEDIGMARQLKQAGAKIMIMDGQKLYSIRMYHSFEEIWVGWRKNIFVAMKKSFMKMLYYIAWVFGFVLTPWLVVGYHLWMQSGFWLQGLAWAGLGLVAISKAVLCHELNLEKRYLFLFPLGALMMAAIMINSMIHVQFRGGSEWRGRIYSQPEK